jgi:hypothetical protein
MGVIEMFKKCEINVKIWIVSFSGKQEWPIQEGRAILRLIVRD